MIHVQATPTQCRHPVSTPSGQIDLGFISKTMLGNAALRPGPVRLLHGAHGSNGGYGRRHIEDRPDRLRDLKNCGFASAVLFVEYVASWPDLVCREKKERLLLIRARGKICLHVYCAWDDGRRYGSGETVGFWSVTTAFPKSRIRNLDVVWSRR